MRACVLGMVASVLWGVPSSVAAVELSWQPGGVAGGDGVWNGSAAQWWNGSAAVAEVAGADLFFPGPAGAVSVEGVFAVASMRFGAPGYRLGLDNFGGARLETGSVDGGVEFGFRGNLEAGADQYPALEELRAVGLWITPTADTRLEGSLVAVEGGSPVLGVRGSGGAVEFAGRWQSDAGSIYSWAVLDEGGHLRLGPDSDMRFIKEGFYTLQLWVSGDGSGVLELMDGFVADRTEQGARRMGIGSIRMGAGTLISHTSANLPLGYRPRNDGSAQTNGHLVFENQPGGHWVVRGTDQVYPGAVWIFQDMTLETQTDLAHVGVTEDGPGYTAQNGFSVLRAATVTKRGAGTLTLAGEQSYAAGARMRIEEGSVVMRSDPASGRSMTGSIAGAQLGLEVAEGARLEWATDGALQSLVVAGDFVLGGAMQLRNGSYADFAATSRTRLTLSDGAPQTWVDSDGLIFVSGDLVVTREPGYLPAAGSEWVICRAGDVLGEWNLIDRTGMELQLVNAGGVLRLVAGRDAPDLPGEVWLEDDFAEGGAAAHWKDLSTVPRWGSPLAHGSAFDWTGGVVRLQRSGARDTRAYTGYNTANGLKTFTALDHQFARAVRHAGSEVTIDFRLRWPTVDGSSGEGGRVIFALTHAYPEGGLDLTPEGQAGSRLADFGGDWWARPTYHVRLRNSDTRAGPSFLQYGGGAVTDGEFERTDNWWLPGFISGAGQIAPGNGDEFPANSWVATREGMASTEFRSFRYRILPDRQELWRDANDDGVLDDDELAATMPLPPTSTAPFYNYFAQFEGLRIFWNGRNDSSTGDSGQMELDWVRVTVQENLSPAAHAGPEQFASTLVEGRAAVRLDASASADPEGDELLYFWHGTDGLLAPATPDPRSVVMLPAGEHVIGLVVVDAAGNTAAATTRVTVTVGKARPVAEAGNDQTVTAVNEWFGLFNVSGAASFSPSTEASIVRYQWSVAAGSRVLYDGPEAVVPLALEIGSHLLTLTVWDSEGMSAEDTVRVTVESQAAQAPPQLIYRENFSRVDDGTEMGPWEVGWNLTSYTGEPVPSVKFDGNAHRSLSIEGSANWLPRVGSNPTGTEYNATNALGHMWMNQMPYQNATPSEWLLWTGEFTFDRSIWDLAGFRFHGTDSSPEHVKVAPAVRIGEQWYVGWDLRIQKRQSESWVAYNLPVAATGWYLFEPGPAFSIRDARPVSRLPDGDFNAFGLYFFKDYGWYVNRIDNVELWVRPRAPEQPYARWLVDHFPPAALADATVTAAWQPQQDADGDGWAAIWEYAMGTDPLSRDVALASAAHHRIDAGRFIAEFNSNPMANDLVFSAEVSSDLKTWAPRAADRETFVDPTNGALRLRLSIPLEAASGAGGAGAPNLFVRWIPAFAGAD